MSSTEGEPHRSRPWFQALELPLLSASPADHGRRLVVDDRYWPWVRNWVAMPDGFQRAGQLLAEHLEDHDAEFDFLVAPLIFLFRHAVELRLKAVQRTAQIYGGGSADPPHGHGLVSRWLDLLDLLRRLPIAINEGQADAVGAASASLSPSTNEEQPFATGTGRL